MALNSVAPDDWSFTPQAVVDCWKGSFMGDDLALRDEMLEEIAATIDYSFNVADHDESIYSILTSAVLHAAAYISRQPCTCTDDEPCERCLALGRYFDKRNDR
jgi:hypothetical protein